jgi:hypothetical protein
VAVLETGSNEVGLAIGPECSRRVSLAVRKVRVCMKVRTCTVATTTRSGRSTTPRGYPRNITRAVLEGEGKELVRSPSSVTRTHTEWRRSSARCDVSRRVTRVKLWITAIHADCWDAVDRWRRSTSLQRRGAGGRGSRRCGVTVRSAESRTTEKTAHRSPHSLYLP